RRARPAAADRVARRSGRAGPRRPGSRRTTRVPGRAGRGRARGPGSRRHSREFHGALAQSAQFRDLRVEFADPTPAFLFLHGRGLTGRFERLVERTQCLFGDLGEVIAQLTLDEAEPVLGFLPYLEAHVVGEGADRVLRVGAASGEPDLLVVA